MNESPSDFNFQLSELTSKLAGMVAERLSYWSKNLEPNERRRIIEMVENQLPTVIANSVAKSASLHSAGGVEYFEQNLENMADAYAKKFVGKL